MNSAKKMDVHFSSKTGDWATPQKLYNALDAKFGPFDLDVCADHENRKAPFYCTPEGLFQYYPSGPFQRYGTDGLTARWSAEFSKCYCNPPYGREIQKWIKKASDEAAKGALVCCLIPARLGSKWMRDLIKKPLVASKSLRGWTDELGDWIEGDTLIVGELAGRVKFGDAKTSAPFPSMVVVFKPRISEGSITPKA